MLLWFTKNNTLTRKSLLRPPKALRNRYMEKRKERKERVARQSLDAIKKPITPNRSTTNRWIKRNKIMKKKPTHAYKDQANLYFRKGNLVLIMMEAPPAFSF